MATNPSITQQSHSSASPRLEDFIDDNTFVALVAAARIEDLGPHLHDVTSELFIPVDAQADAAMRSRAAGVWCGGARLPDIARIYDPSVVVEDIQSDGLSIKPNTTLARFQGPLRSILAMERVALNFAIHLSGIATLTHRFVDAIKATSAIITDTRKTIPGLRSLEKYAVVCGGGHSHRMGLHDAILIKDNHLAGIPASQLTEKLRDMTTRSRQWTPKLKFIEVEVDTLEQLRAVLPTGVDIVLLDNMDIDTLMQAADIRKAIAPHVLLEASGGVTLDTVAAIARTGVDRIAVGAITHSAPAFDLGLDL